jgi:DNA-directed RNA polymerase specialized sigma24 family protein
VRTIERVWRSSSKRAVQLLPPDQRTTLMLDRGRPQLQGSRKVAGVPVGTIMSRLARAHRLAAALETGGGSRRSLNNAEAQ